MTMRPEVIEELTKRINIVANGGTVGNVWHGGINGSLINFNMAIDSMTAMTKEEWDSCVYDEWIKTEHLRIWRKIESKERRSLRKERLMDEVIEAGYSAK